MVERLFLAVPQGSLQFVIVVFPDHTHLLFWTKKMCPYIDDTDDGQTHNGHPKITKAPRAYS